MNINIKATNTTLSPSIKGFIEEKLQTLSKFIREEDKIHVEIVYGILEGEVLGKSPS